MVDQLGKRVWNWQHTYCELPERFYSLVKPVAVSAPELFVFNESLACELDLDGLCACDNDALASMLCGNNLPAGAKPLAMAYAGHQFGNFVVLGDGRAILLGEHLDHSGRRHDIQLKGAGRTPYSRRGDGRAALGPMLREYLISEAMAAMGIATTRSLAVVETGEPVYREDIQPGAILVRTASSHLRVGTFEYFAAQDDRQALEALVSYTINRHYPELSAEPKPALALLEAVQRKQAELIASWQAVGFVHGVLNTDNVALSGETIDYGPCAFLDRYDPSSVYSSIDRDGRYAYSNQPAITAWNMARFAETLLPLIDPDIKKTISMAEEALKVFPQAFGEAWLRRMAPKLGIETPRSEDRVLVEDWLKLLESHKLDFTNAFRALSEDLIPERLSLQHPDFSHWKERLDHRLEDAGIHPDNAHKIRMRTNPRRMPRNHAVQKALDAAVGGDPKPFQKALEALSDPYGVPQHGCIFSSTPSEGDQVCTTYCGT